ncbi:amidase signature enzyme [Sporormia fimetaria CBS 119925]|uniref:Amidase signature enzyme n=1 Tax=Sporormia fimetaria CBS 119925 TaxID=1340428 RepID=A0A6A6VQV8_9PLEO|nr:amidase signature enzyme [Sporormia fimetaria CBS 119925]
MGDHYSHSNAEPWFSRSISVQGNPATVLVTVGDNQYTIWEGFERQLPSTIFQESASGYVPATVISFSRDSQRIPQDTEAAIDELANDDVWTDGFRQLMVVQEKNRVGITHLGTEVPDSLMVELPWVPLPDGPYLIDTSTGKVHGVARCYKDPLHAFTRGGVVFDSSSTLYNRKWRPVGHEDYLAPSRSYYRHEPSKPLNGLRFAVKDVIDVAGLKTGNGSRAWLENHPPAEKTAPFVQQLVSFGAIFVGKLRCTQFCDGQDPSERFEEISPFNPRGDGYQSPSSSSSGSAVAAAGYDWVDFTIGTDTGGSIRHPAGVNGVYGMRPTLRSVSLDGVLSSSTIDTVGVLARSAAILERAHLIMTDHYWLTRQPAAPPVIRYKLLYPMISRNADQSSYPRWFTRPEESSMSPHVDAVFERVVVELEEHLRCRRQAFYIDELWAQTHPEIMDPDLAKATGRLYQKLVYRHMAQMVQPFIERHRRLNDGRQPYLEPVLKKRIEYGASLSFDDFQAALPGVQGYQTWLHNVLFGNEASVGASEPGEIVIMVFPQSWGTPSYRTRTNPAPKQGENERVFWEGFSPYSISYISGCPDITVPVGQVASVSEITGQAEWLPISMSFLSQVGNDRLLTGLLKQLEEKGALKAVDTGSKTYRHWEERSVGGEHSIPLR